ncbi:unnamed protein product [Caenorhabditis brenneri]
MGFPILRLPFLALKVVMNHLNDVGLVTVSLLSKKADRFLKACGKKNVSFFNLNRPEIRVLRDIVIILIDITSVESIEKCAGIKKNLKIGDSVVPFVITKDNEGAEAIHYILSSENDGLKTIFEYFKNHFNAKVEELNLSGKDPSVMRTVVNHIHSTQTVVKNVTMGSINRRKKPIVYLPISGDDFEFILKNVSATERFSFHWKPCPNFKFEGTISAKNINIENGDWCTIQNLIAIENEVIHVDGSEYTKEELRTFLNEWKAGKLPELKGVMLATEVPARDVIEGYERSERECGFCQHRPSHFITIKGPGGCHGWVNTSNANNFDMKIHHKLY